MRRHLSNSLHEKMLDRFGRRSENHSIIIQRSLFSHSHHFVVDVLWHSHVTPSQWFSRLEEQRAGQTPFQAWRKFLKKSETIHVRLVFVFLCFQRQAEKTADSITCLNGSFSRKAGRGSETLYRQLECEFKRKPEQTFILILLILESGRERHSVWDE